MKRITYIITAASLAIMFGCSQHKTAAVNTSNLKPGKHQYKAVFEKDSASLSLDINEYGAVTGKMLISYGEIDSTGKTKGPNKGDIINGVFKGDTLFADFNFTSGANKFVYTNPIALLHKGDTLIMGSGRIMSYLGRNYLEPTIPIDYVKSRFKFLPVGSK